MLLDVELDRTDGTLGGDVCIGSQEVLADLLISRSAEDWASPALAFIPDWGPSDD